MPNTTSTPSPAVPDTMVAAVGRRYGGPEVVAVEEVPTPSPGRGELLVRVEASSLNALDWHFLTGTPYFIRAVGGLRRPRHLVRGADVAGTVVAVGHGVTGFTPGDEVFGECRHGGFAPYATVKAAHAVAKPPGVSWDAAGATPIAGQTALQAVRTHGAVQAGDRVLVNGAAGSVGTFAVQLATVLGAQVTAVCSTRNVERVRGLGAVEVLDYTKDDVAAAGPPFDVMVDNVGNLGAQACLGLLGPGGRYVAVSGPKENRWLGPVPTLLRDARTFRKARRNGGGGPTFHQFTASTDLDDLAFLGGLLADGRLVPSIERVVGLDGVADGLAEIGTGHARAKIVVLPT
jgi:NADPH:quinone reductase-like Zn-dependent oxidoreductase